MSVPYPESYDGEAVTLYQDRIVIDYPNGLKQEARRDEIRGYRRRSYRGVRFFLTRTDGQADKPYELQIPHYFEADEIWKGWIGTIPNMWDVDYDDIQENPGLGSSPKERMAAYANAIAAVMTLGLITAVSVLCGLRKDTIGDVACILLIAQPWVSMIMLSRWRLVFPTDRPTLGKPSLILTMLMTFGAIFPFLTSIERKTLYLLPHYIHENSRNYLFWTLAAVLTGIYVCLAFSAVKGSKSGFIVVILVGTWISALYAVGTVSELNVWFVNTAR